jgi:hypothetical protein
MTSEMKSLKRWFHQICYRGWHVDCNKPWQVDAFVEGNLVLNGLKPMIRGRILAYLVKNKLFGLCG